MFSGFFDRLRTIYRSIESTPVAVERIETILRAHLRSPVEQFVFDSYVTRDDGLFDGSYELWRTRRITKILEIFGLDYFSGKKVLELGAAHGDIGAFFAELGSEVTCAEGRTANISFGQLKYRDVPRLRFQLVNLDEDFSRLGKFDLIIHFGVLYHVQDVEQHLRRCFELSDDLLLETVVCDSTDPDKIFMVDERTGVNEESISGKGSRPSPFYVERIAKENGFEVTRYFTADLNAGNHYVYDWEHKNDDSFDGWRLRRFWRLRRVAKSPT